MKTMWFKWRLLSIAILAFAMAANAGTPTSVPSSGEQQIRDAALAVLDTRRQWDVKVLDQIVLESDVERLFASEMLRAMRAEQSMGRRAAAAASGSGDSDAVRQVDQAFAATPAAILDAKIDISGESATMPFAPGGDRATILTFRKVQGRWQFDFLRRYRERKQIDAGGIAKWKGREQAAEEVARMYERKEEQDLSVLPVLYETMSDEFAEAAAKQIGSSLTTRPKE